MDWRAWKEDVIDNRPEHPDPGKRDCPICKGLGYVRSDVADVHHPMFGKLVPCDCRAEELAERVAERSGMRDHELARALDDIVPRAERFRVEQLAEMDLKDVQKATDTAGMVELCRRFVAEPWGWLTVWGPYGNAKTHALQAVVNEFRLRYRLVGAYITLADLFGIVREGFSKDAKEDAAARLERFRTLPLLAVDEIDAAQMSDWSEETRRRIFDSRYRDGVARKRYTVLAMNCNPRDLPGDLYDRIRDGRFAVYNNADKSARPAMGDWTD